MRARIQDGMTIKTIENHFKRTVRLQDRHCCKKDASNVLTQEQPISYALTGGQLLEDDLRNHPNINIINQKNCGRSISNRIIGGFKVGIGEYPWSALLMYKPFVGDGAIEFNCGGSLISRKHVLSAAQCVISSGSSGFTL